MEVRDSSFVSEFVRTYGFYPICGGDGTGVGDEGAGAGSGANSGEGDTGSKNEPEAKTYSFGGKELTVEEVLEQAKSQFNENQRMRGILADPEKVQQYYIDKFGNKQPTQPAGDPDEQARQEQAKAALRELGVQFAEDAQVDRELLREEVRVENRLDDLSREINGTDGRPPFNPGDVIGFLQDTGFVGSTLTKDVLTEAYEKLHKDDLAKWRAAKGESGKPAPHSERGGGGGGKPSKPAPKISFDGEEGSLSVADAAAAIIAEGEG